MPARRIVVLVAVGSVVLGIAGLVAMVQRPSRVEAALAVVDNDDRFATALDASDAFAEISGLLDDVECDPRRDQACARILRASAWARVTAVLVAKCTPPAVHEARAALGRYLRGDGELPAAPRCGGRRQGASS